MKTKLAILALLAATSIGSNAFAQGAAGSGEGGAAAIPGSEVRAGESPRRLNSDQGVTTGSGELRSVDRDTAVTPNGRRVDTNIAPGGAVGRSAPDAEQAAPAGR